jgi:UDP-GlcNAc:undecaprenyl-phosphate GlcNAc-1-phosphate transferase
LPLKRWRTPLNAYWIILLISAALSLGLTPLFRKIALRTNFVDSPAGQLKRHTAPVAYLGGLAVYFAFLLTLFGSIIFLSPTDTPKILAVIFGGTIMALLGLADDLFFLKPGLKFLVQFIAAACLIIFGVHIKFIFNPWLDWVVTLFWVVGVTNALNLIDIMDGLAGGVTVLAALAFVFVPLGGEPNYVNLVAAALAGSTLGFLPFNYQPAKIYLGDSGALFIGFVLASVAMGESYTQTNVVSLAAPILILGVPIYDTILVMFLRFLKGKSMFQGSHDHLALRLRFLGMTVKQVVHSLWGLTALCCVAAYFLIRLSEKRAFIFLLTFFFAATLWTLFVALIPIDGPSSSGWMSGAQSSPKKKNLKPSAKSGR